MDDEHNPIHYRFYGGRFVHERGGYRFVPEPRSATRARERSRTFCAEMRDALDTPEARYIDAMANLRRARSGALDARLAALGISRHRAG